MDIKKIKDSFEFYKNFPKEGINFIDIGSIMREGENLKALIDYFVEKIKENFEFDKIATLESRGFLFAAPIAYAMNKGLVMVRKKGKLPGEVVSVASTKEYGEDILEIQKNSIRPNERVLIIDDILATGGTAKASISLIEKAGGKVSGLCFVGEILDLKGKELFKDYKSLSLFEF